MIMRQFILGVFVLAFACAVVVTAQSNNGPEAKPFKEPSRDLGDRRQEAASRIFEQNCARCHDAPNSFSPRISETILRHMRVRASLSQRDEEELLHFLNP